MTPPSDSDTDTGNEFRSGSDDLNPDRPEGAERSVGDAGSDLDALLQRLELAGVESQSTTAPLERIASEASTHADALRATLEAQKQAQRMLTLAAKVRGEASAQAEQIMLEAQSAAERMRVEAEDYADRARKDMTSWASAQRKAVDEGIEQLIQAATRDAEAIRAEALRTSMAEAERAAEKYVAHASAAGHRDAEALRADARELLSRSADMVGDSQHSLHQFADSLAGFLVGIQRQLDAMAELTGEAREGIAVQAAAAAQVDHGADLDGKGENEDEGDSESISGKVAGSMRAAKLGKPDKAVMADDEGDDEGQDEPPPAGKDADDKLDSASDGRSQEGRPLGSLFRGNEGR